MQYLKTFQITLLALFLNACAGIQQQQCPPGTLQMQDCPPAEAVEFALACIKALMLRAHGCTYANG